MHPLRRLPEHLSGGRDRLEKDQENPAVACTYGKRVRTIREPVGAAAKSSVETSICTTGGSGAGKSDEDPGYDSGFSNSHDLSFYWKLLIIRKI